MFQAVQHLKLQAINTEYRKTLTFTNSAVPICTASNPPFLYCQFQTHAQLSPSAGHLTLIVKLTETFTEQHHLGTGYRWFVRITSRSLYSRGRSLVHTNNGSVWTPEPFWSFWRRKHSPLPELEIWDRQSHSYLRSPTAQFSSRNLNVGNLVAYWKMVAGFILAILCNIRWKFWGLYVLFRHAGCH
jgi:hypothetical protein